MKKALSFALCLAMAASMTACGGSANTTTAAETQTAAESQTTAETQAQETKASIVQTGDASAIAVSTDNFSFTQGEIVYLYSMVYRNYSSYLSLLGVDTTKLLKDQIYQDDKTWFDMFMEETLTYARKYLTFCEAANAEGITLQQDDLDYIEQQKKAIADGAAEAGKDEAAYLEDIFGTNITTADVCGAIEKLLLADRYYDAMVESYGITDDMINQTFAASPEKYQVIDYKKVSLSVGDNALTAEQAADYADRFAAVSSEAAFDELAKEVILASTSDAVKETMDSEDAYVSSKLTAATTIAAGYDEGDAFKVWAFGEGRQVGNVYVSDKAEDGSCQAYILTALPYKDTSTTVDIRHILFMSSTYGTLEDAHAKAEEVYNNWVSAGASEDEFIKLAAEYSEDSNAQSGGIYEGVEPGEMVQTFNDWIFTPGRQYGDHGIVDTQYGAHIMFFIKSNEEAWYTAVKDELEYEAYNEASEKIESQYTVNENADVLNSIVY